MHTNFQGKIYMYLASTKEGKLKNLHCKIL
jgi:hypothetical protein